jgi:hypothetical protein
MCGGRRSEELEESFLESARKMIKECVDDKKIRSWRETNSISQKHIVQSAVQCACSTFFFEFSLAAAQMSAELRDVQQDWISSLADNERILKVFYKQQQWNSVLESEADLASAQHLLPRSTEEDEEAPSSPRRSRPPVEEGYEDEEEEEPDDSVPRGGAPPSAFQNEAETLPHTAQDADAEMDGTFLDFDVAFDFFDFFHSSFATETFTRASSDPRALAARIAAVFSR